ncbi:hypothetical protein BDZ85DRAFT_256754 [Elsinoe ampelina]|uniref:Uncharacterized protein n=1 Tax=Elsinoe ampelina TaxID=302913 RepID=A0A6A6GM77_9PEZI|nr:hypothetical protein BDZ85DRAFT_256754 [Elsinoe ampelina]
MSRLKKRQVRCWWWFPSMACEYDLTKDYYHFVGITLLGLCRWDVIDLVATTHISSVVYQWRWCCKERPDRAYLLIMQFVFRTDG